MKLRSQLTANAIQHPLLGIGHGYWPRIFLWWTFSINA